MQNIIETLDHNPATYLTDSYHAVDSRQLIDHFNKAGFSVVNQGKSSLRVPCNPVYMPHFQELTTDQQMIAISKYNTRLARYNARLGHEKHFLRFKSNDLKTKVVGHDLFLRISNSYDGTSSLHITLDILRLVCLNGMVAPRSIFHFSVTHRSKDIFADAIEAAYKIIAKKDIIDDQITRMTNTVLTEDKKLLLVNKMFAFRFPETKWQLTNEQKLDLLIPSRQAESNDNLYQNFNTLQEKFTKGSQAVMFNDQGESSLRKIREVKSIVTADEFNDKSREFALSLAA
jgi:hypothetical protein